MKKGFTLIELLVIIVVIGLVAMIAFPTVGNIITSMKERSFVESRKGLIRAAKLYMEANQDLLPYNAGDVTEVSISTLVNEKYIKEIKSPVDGSTCGGYILVRQNDQTAYDYYPQYRCGASNGITSRATDSLVLDYTFDDFQEPTVNLVPNPSGTTLTNSVPGNYRPGWDVNLHNDALVASTWSAGYNGGVPSPAIGYHARWIKENGNPMMLFEDRNDLYSLGHRWLGIAVGLGNSTTAGLTVNKPITVSWKQKTDVASKGANPGLYHTLISTGTNGFESNIQTIYTSKINQWERANFSSVVGTNWDLTKNFTLYVYGSSGAYGKLWVDDVQVELKPYATPFTEGTRTGTVTDYSGNGHSASLSLDLTPRWIEDRNGSYYFDGTKYFQNNPTMTLNSFSFTTWVNPFYYGNSTSKTTTGLGSSSNIVSLMRTTGTYSSGPFWLEYRQNGNLDIYIRNEASTTVRVVVPLLSVDKWTQLSITYNHLTGVATVYADGEFVATATNVAVGSLGALGRLYVGTGLGTATTGNHYNGSIDQIKMFNRVLAADEIKSLYYMERVN